MKTNYISARNIGCMITLMINSSQLMTGFSSVKQDLWAAVGAAIIMSAPLIVIVIRILNLNPGKDLYDIIYGNFGKVTSWIMTLLLSWYALSVSSLVTRNFSEFVSTISLEKTPGIIIIVGMLLTAGYLAGSNFKIIGRWSLVSLIVVGFVLLLTLVFSIEIMDFDYLKPVLKEHSFSEVVSSGFTFGMIAFAETVIAMTAFGDMKPGDKPIKAYGAGVGMGAFIVMAATLRNILVLGREMLEYTIFPSYVATRVIRMGNFFEHLESVIAFIMILMGITKSAICLRASAVGVKKLFNLKVSIKHIVIFLVAAASIFSTVTFSNMHEMMSFADMYRYYAISFTVVIPIMIWIKSEIKNRKNNKNIAVQL